ncbi:uncharacterized protein H6S33_006487 [Morchella sextelata]|uniref:uncharacterized protein n=1 Tax=Morchella sextelata TaxID=1174677 RepID=UPI001D041B89|nr:uncharacterized protein H6S33_006487 [Morchella sextelata]KAH0604819.1 hypothetical protein H6S33_006487 [Morchella sextelata]
MLPQKSPIQPQKRRAPFLKNLPPAAQACQVDHQSHQSAHIDNELLSLELSCSFLKAARSNVENKRYRNFVPHRAKEALDRKIDR